MGSRLGLGRREPAADQRRRRQAGERRPDPELEELHPDVQVAGPQHRRRASTTASRCSGARTCCSTARTRSSRAPNDWAALYDPKYKGQITIPNNPIQIADAAFYLMHSKPEPRHHRPVRAEQEAVRRDGQPAQAAAEARQALLELRHRRPRCVRERRRLARGDLAGGHARPPGEEDAGQGGHPEGGRDRLGRHLDAAPRRPRIRTAPTSG